MAQSALLVKDARGTHQAAGRALARAGFDVVRVNGGEDALMAIRTRSFDLVALSVALPDMDGVDVCRRVRLLSPETPILLMGDPDTTEVVLSLEFGADDYLKEPFDPRELVARARAILRRTGASSQRALAMGKVLIDPAGHRVLKEGEEVPLSVIEFRLLLELASEPDRALTREELVKRVWNTQHLGASRVVDMAIRRLRAKLEDNPHSPRIIKTVRGVGYRIDPDAVEEPFLAREPAGA